MVADYKCTKCEKVIEYKKAYGENFPEKMYCPECNDVCAKRVWTIPFVEVPEGKLGNSKTGYAKNIVNHGGAGQNLKGRKVK